MMAIRQRSPYGVCLFAALLWFGGNALMDLGYRLAGQIGGCQ